MIDRHEHEGDTVADVLRDLVGALETDTLLFRSDSPPELAPFLAQRWDPLLAWFSSRCVLSPHQTCPLTSYFRCPRAL